MEASPPHQPPEQPRPAAGPVGPRPPEQEPTGPWPPGAPPGYDPTQVRAYPYGSPQPGWYPYGPPQPATYPYGPPQKRRGMPAWAIVLIMLAVVGPIVMGILAAIAIPTFVNQRDSAKDSSVKAGVHSIQIAIESWAADRNGVYPAADEISADGSWGQYMGTWPVNPWTDKPMQRGTAEGDFEYLPSADGSDYTLIVHLSGGKTLTIH